MNIPIFLNSLRRKFQTLIANLKQGTNLEIVMARTAIIKADTEQLIEESTTRLIRGGENVHVLTAYKNTLLESLKFNFLNHKSNV